ncbi:hypothetical protein [Nonomuraea sp. B19D2]|uniref:hypothetical protein n=1 Tax=Nonomuraea sp. B19D2 TaxID=3159561 RepID=UPI0032DB02F7
MSSPVTVSVQARMTSSTENWLILIGNVLLAMWKPRCTPTAIHTVPVRARLALHLKHHPGP